MLGKVKWFNNDKGFGFITCDGLNSDVFIHYSNINMLGRKELYPNQLVEFDLVENENNQYSAKNLFLCEVQNEC